MEAERFEFEVARFRDWASTVPVGRRTGEWEVDYWHWPTMYTAWDALLAEAPPSSWQPALLATALYAIARDNENEYLVRKLSSTHGVRELAFVARASLADSDSDARLDDYLARAENEPDPDLGEYARKLRAGDAR